MNICARRACERLLAVVAVERMRATDMQTLCFNLTRILVFFFRVQGVESRWVYVVRRGFSHSHHYIFEENNTHVGCLCIATVVTNFIAIYIPFESRMRRTHKHRLRISILKYPAFTWIKITKSKRKSLIVSFMRNALQKPKPNYAAQLCKKLTKG